MDQERQERVGSPESPSYLLFSPKFKLSPDNFLHHELSTRPSLSPLQDIGMGSCGIVFSHFSLSYVFKREIANSGLLWNDLVMHSVVQETFDQVAALNLDIRIPRCYGYINASNQNFFATNYVRFPEPYGTPGNILVSERIPPLSRPVRDALVDLYIPSAALAAANTAEKSNSRNRDCLARVYLGRRRDPNCQTSRMFTLRNFHLCIDQMEELGLEILALAQKMADALAVMHWCARIDADGVEFVLGSLPPAPIRAVLPRASRLRELKPNSDTSSPLQDFNPHTPNCGLYLLDFDRCHPISMDGPGVDQAVKAFLRNDPYFPRPLTGNPRDENVWRIFRESYLKTSKIFAPRAKMDLSELFIAKVVKELEAMKKAKMTDNEIAPEA